MANYYNEFDPQAAAWLRELIRMDAIPAGDVDERSIVDVESRDLDGYDQCHFFAGIGGWSRALRQAGWADDRPIWTGSAPCQPFSAAGQQRGALDERHLAPVLCELIRQCRPPIVCGEQVASADVIGKAGGKRAKPDQPAWLDTLQHSLEAAHYTCGEIVIPACCVGAPHIRHRTWWVGIDSVSQWMADNDGLRCQRFGRGGQEGVTEHSQTDWMANSHSNGCGETREGFTTAGGDGAERDNFTGGSGAVNGFWAGADWLGCRDGKFRPSKRSIQPLVDGIPADVVRGSDSGPPVAPVNETSEARTMRIKGYGNAINVEVAVVFIKAVMENI